MESSAPEPRDCVVEINSRLITPGDEPPHRYVHEYEGSVRLLDEHYSLADRIGIFKATVLDIESAVNERESIFDVFDWSQETIGFFEPLYEEDGSFKDPVARLLYGKYGGMWEPNALLLQRLAIKRQFRGFGYGLQALQALIEELRVGVGIIAMKPFPLQFEGRTRNRDEEELSEYCFDQFLGNARTARAKLRRYYARLGFKPVPKTEYMVMSADMTAKLPVPWSRSAG